MSDSNRPTLLPLLLLLAGTSACRASQPRTNAPEAGPVETVVTVGARSSGHNAVPTGEPGVYRIPAALDSLSQVRVVPKDADPANARVLSASEWSFEPATGRLRIGVKVDDERESVVALGARARPPRMTLPEDAKLDTVRVVVGDRLGIEGQDYEIDRATRVLRLLGPDTPESPLRYYARVELEPDPAHPQFTRVVSFGNLGDQETIRRALDGAPR